MTTMDAYLDLAEQVYLQRGDGNRARASEILGNFNVQKWEFATCYGDGYQGAVFEGQAEWVVGFAGTITKLVSSLSSQMTGNVRIALNVIPNMAGSANAMVSWAKSQAKEKPVTVVGHSLGGALAQVVGYWSGCRFISFNGPGMASHVGSSHFNVFKPRQMGRTWKKFGSEANGFSYHVKGDWISGFGVPLGTKVELTTLGKDKHGLDALRSGLAFQILNDPFGA